MNSIQRTADVTKGTEVEPITVLLVTANETYARRVEEGLSEMDQFSVRWESGVTEALHAFDGGEAIDCIVSDHDLPAMDGVAFLQAIRAQAPSLPFILFTGEGSERVASRAITAGVTEYLVRGTRDDVATLASQIEEAVSYYRSRTEAIDPEQRTRDILNAARDVIAVVRDGEYVFLNDEGVERFGLTSRGELLGRPAAATFDADLSGMLSPTGENRDPGDRFLEVETVLDCGYERDLPVELVAVSIQWEDRPATLLIMRDISDRKQLESNLRQFRRAIEAAGHAVYITDRDGTIRDVNDAFVEITGYEAAEAIGETPSLLKSGHHSEEYYEALWETIISGEVWEETVTNQRKNGELYHAQQSIAPVYDGEEIDSFVAIQTDVTETRELEREQQYYRQAIESSTDMIAALDRDERYLFANQAYSDFHETTREDIRGKRLQAVLDEAEYEEVTAYNDDVLDGNTLTVELERSHPELGRRQLDTRVFPLHDDQGTIHGLVASMRDVTPKRELEHELKRSEQIVQRLDDPIMIQDRVGQFVLVNDAVTDRAGLPEEALLGEDEFAFMDPEAAATIGENKAEVLDREKPIQYEITPTFEETGEEATFSTRRYPYYDQDGELAGTMAICRDVTELKAHEEQLQQYKRAVEGAYDLITAVDSDERYLFANEPYCEYHGIDDPEELVGKTLEDVLGPAAYEEGRSYIERGLDGEQVQYRMTRTHPTRGERTLDIRYYPLEDGEAVRGGVAIMRDVTDRAERERQLRVVDRVLRHNVRNTLTAIGMFADQIRLNTDGDVRAAAEKIIDNADELSTTAEKSRSITTVLGETPEYEVVHLDDLVEQVVADFEDSDYDVDIDLTVSESPSVSASGHFYEAVEELVHNAIVHNDASTPRVEIEVSGTDEGVSVEIADNGPGIPSIEREILESGREVDELYHGSGLGLWLVYWIVCRSGGSITVDEGGDSGTLVRLEFPQLTDKYDRSS